jgi:beta-galactosidase
MLNRRVEQFVVSRRHPQHPSGNAAKHKNYLFTIEALRCCHLLTKLRVNPFMKFLNIFSTVVAAFFFLALPVRSPAADARFTEDFDANWLFSKGDFAAAMMPAFDDGNWRSLNVPHDWSSEGPFSAEYGSGNGYAPGGIGWYRKHFRLDAAQKNKLVAIEFDGVYDHSEVWINGQFVGTRPFGFSSFQYDLTPFVKFGSGENVVAVRVDHSRFADSRFYTGSGIYRHVRLSITDKLRIAHWGASVTTPKIKSDSAAIRIETTIENASGAEKSFALEIEIVAPDGEIVAAAKTSATLPATGASASGPARIELPERAGSETGAPSRVITQELVVRNPQLWNLNDPKLHHVVSKIVSDGKILDEVTTPFGIREFHFDADKGFFLNGKNLKLKGVCIHHDAGSLGAAVPDKVLERRLRLLKEIGVNAIRTSHNPPDPELLNLCDRLGFLVMDEAFDEFTPSKNKWVTGRNSGVPSRFGYGEMFAQWSVTDVQDLVRRDRNHPSIILWSIGNEIDYANDPFSDPVLGQNYRPENPPAKDLLKCAAPLVAAVKSLDRTRPVTAALATVAMSNVVGLPELLDAVGYNYQEARYDADHKQFPQRIIYGSENSHQYAAWLAVQTNSFIAGQFLWTGIDYLGEANAWPNRASGAGLLDLCGFKKPIAWFRQSLWSDQPMVYLCVSTGSGGRRGFAGVENWNWPSNSTATVLCFANCPEVILMLNDKIIGTKKLSEAVRGVLSWQIPFEPGTLKAVGRANGQDVCSYVLKTAGSRSRIELLPDATQLRADGKDVCHVEFRIVDENGVRVPNADAEVKFDLTGPSSIIGIGNGDVNSIEDCKTNIHRAFQGRGLAILQTTTTPGSITLKATAPGLESTNVTLQSRQ